MAKKTGPKKGSKQRRKDVAQNDASSGPAPGIERSARMSGTARRTEQPKLNQPSGEDTKKQPAGSRLGALFNSPAVRKVMAATLVSAAGALLFKRGGDGDDGAPRDETDTPTGAATVETESRSPKRTAGARRKSGGRSNAPVSDQTDPLVAAGLAGELGKKRSAASTPRRKSAKAAGETTSSLSEPSTVEAGPGAYPDGSPVDDTAGRTSVEGGSDRPQ